jgi:hypothetical protein
MLDIAGELIAAFSSPKIEDLIRRIVADAMRAELRASPLAADRLVDAEEAGKLLGMSAAAVRKAAVRGQIPSRKVGRRRRFAIGELLQVTARKGSSSRPAISQG